VRPFAVQLIGSAQASGVSATSQKPVQHSAPAAQVVPLALQGLAHLLVASQYPEQQSVPVAQVVPVPVQGTAHLLVPSQ
jgi:hypothetical protein